MGKQVQRAYSLLVAKCRAGLSNTLLGGSPALDLSFLFCYMVQSIGTGMAKAQRSWGLPRITELNPTRRQAARMRNDGKIPAPGPESQGCPSSGGDCTWDVVSIPSPTAAPGPDGARDPERGWNVVFLSL